MVDDIDCYTTTIQLNDVAVKIIFGSTLVKTKTKKNQ
jgi:hypothetical protein